MVAEITVEVVYATTSERHVYSVKLNKGATVKQAVQTTDLCRRCSEIIPGKTPVGIYGRVCTWGTLLRHGDRVEIYRPLLIDPKERRRLQAQRQKNK